MDIGSIHRKFGSECNFLSRDMGVAMCPNMNSRKLWFFCNQAWFCPKWRNIIAISFLGLSYGENNYPQWVWDQYSQCNTCDITWQVKMWHFCNMLRSAWKRSQTFSMDNGSIQRKFGSECNFLSRDMGVAMCPNMNSRKLWFFATKRDFTQTVLIMLIFCLEVWDIVTVIVHSWFYAEISNDFICNRCNKVLFYPNCPDNVMILPLITIVN